MAPCLCLGHKAHEDAVLCRWTPGGGGRGASEREWMEPRGGQEGFREGMDGTPGGSRRASEREWMEPLGGQEGFRMGILLLAVNALPRACNSICPMPVS